MAEAPTRRRRDAARSRERLLEAAAELFADRGYERATARDIGWKAGVDPAMIARYFGGKAQLYIAVLQSQYGVDNPADLLDRDRLAALVERVAGQGPGPILQAVVRPVQDPAAREAAHRELYHRFVVPLSDQLDASGDPDARLRAEVLMAAFTGVALARHAGMLDALASADTDHVTALLQELLSAH